MEHDCITADGFLDPRKLPLGPILTQALQEDEEQFRTGCTVLSSIAAHGGHEAGIFLLGLLAYYRRQPARLVKIVSVLSSFPTEATVDALVAELYRVESTNATRRYLTEVLDALTRLPWDLWESRLVDMAQDAHFSPKWRHKFAAALSAS
jgi:hypothetical protein